MTKSSLPPPASGTIYQLRPDLQTPTKEPMFGGSDGGGGDMERLTRLEGKVDHLDWRMGQMDGRMDRLEGRMDGIDSRLRSVEVGIATLAERVAHLPSKGFIVAALLTGFAIMGALISFQDQIQGLLGIAP